jgi:hypothetical protein
MVHIVNGKTFPSVHVRHNGLQMELFFLRSVLCTARFPVMIETEHAVWGVEGQYISEVTMIRTYACAFDFG